MKSSGSHWDAIFNRTEDYSLGWYEKDASKTMSFLNKIPEWEHSAILVPGAGTSVLIEALLSKGAHLVLNDISQEALNKLKTRLRDKGEHIKWLCQDIALEFKEKMPDIDIWIDRAVLHFLTSEEDINGYFTNVRKTVRAGGHALFAEFSMSGAPKCAGLTLHRYSVEELSQRLGNEFVIIAQEDYIYINPRGETRPYLYALYKRANDRIG
ncbi:MAG: class I SAM-dependent methyltransferase [Desulfobacterium sp.]|nr:class I SAM-dependent methyltransferase [Desulfobacterium sp.]MBU4011600.1 class I SAM-dependent methyltransferase [Pseudomonadota bacterium]MBU4037063.1 class I SAM-dependent methyltransferase [Pseudomonadota bacterium]